MGSRNRGGVFIEPLEARRLLSATMIPSVPGNISLGMSATAGKLLYFNFFGNAGLGESELWRSDGSAAGTFRVDDDNPATASFAPLGIRVIAPLGSKTLVLDNGDANVTTARLWSIDDQTAIASQVGEFQQTDQDSQWAVMNGVFYFAAEKTAAQGVELWRSDGTTAGTYLLKDIDPSADTSSSPEHLTVAGNQLFFSALSSASGDQFFVSDGTSAGTRQVSDLPLAVAGNFTLVQNVEALGKKVFFTAGPSLFPSTGADLYVSDGTAAGTIKLTNGFTADTLAAAQTQLFFRATTDSGSSVWRSDGTAAGTIKIFDDGSNDGDISTFGNNAYFEAGESSDLHDMISDGTVKGTRVGEPAWDLGRTAADWPVAIGGGVYVFRAAASPQQSEYSLYRTDGTAAGTRLVPGLDPVFINAFNANQLLGGASRAYMFNGVDENEVTISVYDPNAGVLTGTVFNDADSDGVRDSGEKGLAGYKVFIDSNNDGICNKKELWTRASVTGRYQFDMLPAGKYTVRIVGVEGRRASTSERVRVSVTGDGTTVRYFGRTTEALLAGLVYMDANKNGTIDNGESGMIGWTVFVDANRDGILDDGESSVVTDAGGKFAIAVAAGNWLVRAKPQAGYRGTSPGAGYRNVTVTAAGVSAKVNFGEKRLK